MLQFPQTSLRFSISLASFQMWRREWDLNPYLDGSRPPALFQLSYPFVLGNNSIPPYEMNESMLSIGTAYGI